MKTLDCKEYVYLLKQLKRYYKEQMNREQGDDMFTYNSGRYEAIETTLKIFDMVGE